MTLQPVPPPSSFSRLGKTGAVIAIVALAGVAVVGGASYLGRQVGSAFGDRDAATAPVDVEPGLDVEIEVPLGSSAQDIAAILAAQGVVRSAVSFEAAVRSAGAAASLRAGTYELVTGMEPGDVIEVLEAGPSEDVIRVTVREGLRVSEITAQLAEETGLDESGFVEALLEGTVTTALRRIPEEPTLQDWEGLLFPDTYEFVRSASAASIMQRLAATMEQRMAAVDWTAIEEAGFDRYQGLIIASLIESEVRVEDERTLVSSVIHNRLDLEMLLQIDATVLYALATRSPEEFDNEVDSPYNTYRFPGLPPTPINAPGLASLEAAAAPAETEFLFYVLSADDGSHTFTTNLDDHNAAVNRARQDGVLP